MIYKLLLILFIPTLSYGQLSISNGCKVVFLGDSITDAGYYSHYLESFYVLRNPSYTLHFRTEGRGGAYITESTTGGRYEKNVMSYLPDIVCMMFTPNSSGTASNVFYSDYSVLTSECVETNAATPVLLGVHPLDRANGDTGMRDRSDAAAALASANGWLSVNTWRSLITPFSNNYALSHPIDLGWADVTHPGAAGHLCIAYAILSGLAEDGLVSTATINGSATNSILTTNCTISSVSISGTNLSFNRLDTKLPMAWDTNAVAALQMFTTEIYDLNRYMLYVTNIVSGNYRLKIDGVEVAQLTATELQNGYNLTRCTNGPIHDQLLEVLGTIRDKHGVDRSDPSEPVGPPWSGVESYRSSATAGWNDGLRGQDLIDYLAPKVVAIDLLDEDIHDAAQPVTRTFTLENMDGNAIIEGTSPPEPTTNAYPPVRYRWRGVNQ